MNSLSSKLKEMLHLEETREILIAQLDGLTTKLGELKNMLDLDSASDRGSVSPAPRGPQKTAAAGARKMPPRRRKRAARGAMKASILGELEKAGPSGIAVQELAANLGVRNTVVHAWFNTTGKKNKNIKKVGTARYALTGSASAAADAPAKTPKKTRRRRTAKAGKTSRTAKAGKVAAPARRGTAKKGKSNSSRGELKSKITSTLEKAGSKGMTVRAISDKINVPYKNVYIWFVTTGKKNSSIERIAPATYRLQS